MIDAVHLRATAAEYRANAKKVGDARTREQYTAVAAYLDEWAAETEAKDDASTAAHRHRRAV